MDWNETANVFLSTNVTNTSVPLSTLERDNGSTKTSGNWPPWYESGRIQIPLYAIIFMLAVIGNTLVILTLVSDMHTTER